MASALFEHAQKFMRPRQDKRTFSNNRIALKYLCDIKWAEYHVTPLPYETVYNVYYNHWMDVIIISHFL